MINKNIVSMVSDTLVTASTIFSEDKKIAYQKAIEKESNENAKWVLETTLKNAGKARDSKFPMCDDTGIPHILIEVGDNCSLTNDVLMSIEEGVAEGLRNLPGRPMGVKGNDIERIEQSAGLFTESEAVVPAPFILKYIEGRNELNVHVLMQGGGPAIRGLTKRIFHKHSIKEFTDEIVNRANEAVKMLGCTPTTLAIGVGRSQSEATSLMTEAQIFGSYANQSELEQEITNRVNESNVGALGLGGDTSVLGTFMRVGPQRASGVRVVCIRPCCSIEPRYSKVNIYEECRNDK